MRRAACVASGPSVRTIRTTISNRPICSSRRRARCYPSPAVEVRGDPGEGERDGLLQFAEVDIEVFDFRAPAAAESPFHSAAHSPTGAYVLDGCHGTGRG